MEFGWTQDQESLYESTRNFAANQLGRDLTARESRAELLEDDWAKVARQGIFGLCFPREHGGQGLDLVTAIHAMEGLGYGCRDNGLTLAVNGQMWAVQEPILHAGTEEQKQKYLPRLISGELKGAHGMTEPESGSDAFSLQTTAAKTDGGYLLNGKKIFIGLGPVADLILVFATVDSSRGRWGVTAFLVDGDAPGVTLGANQSKMGLRTGPMGDIDLENVFVPDANVLGREGSGASVFSASMVYERSFIFASHVGSMARQLDETNAYSKRRQQGGRAIKEYQSISNRLANMKVRLETARLFLYKAAWAIDRGGKADLESAMAKLSISELFVENSMDAMRIHGGRGYMTDRGVERDLRDALGGVLYSGTSDIQRNLIASLMDLA